jgi:hypothetical protein
MVNHSRINTDKINDSMYGSPSIGHSRRQNFTTLAPIETKTAKMLQSPPQGHHQQISNMFSPSSNGFSGERALGHQACLYHG